MKAYKRGDRVAVLNLKTQEVMLDGIVLVGRGSINGTVVDLPTYGPVIFNDSSMSVGTLNGLFGLLDDTDARVKARKRDAHVALTRRALALWLDKASSDDLDHAAKVVEGFDSPGWVVALDDASR